ncbi:MAG: 16S rRNA (guanine(966)-N(2))-methyltransferase RsmD [Eubacteriales bacterium]|nr:16S rRNA (guanine(966)-N(2))-methyltransferase RsmD [Eubacteriales bacterium]
MRIIAGTAGGRVFEAPKGLDTRPTLDRVKEGIFGSLQFDIPYSDVLDLFSGSGNLGLEAASRGAKRVVCNDHDAGCAAMITDNAKVLGLDGIVSVLQLDYRDAIARLMQRNECFDIVFLDAPYYQNVAQNACELLFRGGMIKDGGVVVVEHDFKLPPHPIEGLMRVRKTKKYGICGVTMLQKEDVL